MIFYILILIAGITFGIIFSKLIAKHPKHVGTLMVIDTEEGPQLFVELNQGIHMFINEERITLDISHK